MKYIISLLFLVLLPLQALAQDSGGNASAKKSAATETRCTSKSGCQCGDTVIPNGSDCVNDVGYCHGKPIANKSISNYSDYRCARVSPMFICTNPDGCVCKNKKCILGSECYDGECYCGNKTGFEQGGEFNVCQHGKPESNSHIHDEYWDDYFYDLNAANFSYPEIINGVRHCPSQTYYKIDIPCNPWKDKSTKCSDDKKLTMDDITQTLICTDCDDFSCSDGPIEKKVTHPKHYAYWLCLVYHGCTVNGKHYDYLQDLIEDKGKTTTNKSVPKTTKQLKAQ